MEQPGGKTVQRQFAKPPYGLAVLLMCGNENSPETIRKTALRAYCFAHYGALAP